ncbi:MAG: hypothetical protein JOS17DRAFT_752106 [Linnemannia elongata]|nr:MAG: hypothetical protein JOS17DRAFT_752106 [Linnemannia elongata]
MDPLSQLPLECLHIILEYLAHNKNTFRLTPLLQTNLYLATVVLPYLYNDPYQFAPYEKTSPLSYDTIAKDPFITQIPTRTLLNSLPPSTALHKVLSLALNPVESSVSPVSTNPSRTTTVSASAASGSFRPLDYLAQVRHLHHQPWAIGDEQLWKWAQPPPGVASLLNTQEFLDLCQADHLVPTHDWRWFVRNKQQFNQSCFAVLFFREASWALAEPILEQLQSLTIPTSTIGRYLGSASMRPLRKLERRLESLPIGRLRRLERLHFLLDRVSTRALDVADETRKEEELEFGSMVRFVQEHTRIFPGVLKEMTTSQSPLWTVCSWNYSCPTTIQIEINRMLPAMVKPTSLNTKAQVFRFLAHPMETDLSRVVDLDLTLFKSSRGDGKAMLNQSPKFIQRCRALRKLEMEGVQEDAFAWAVEEKRLLDQLKYTNGGVMIYKDIREYDDWRENTARLPELWRSGLVPLEDVVIRDWSSTSTTPTRVVDDLAISFSQTLKHLGWLDWSRDEVSFVPSLPCYIGENWEYLPGLTHLELYAASKRIVIDRHLLTRCPNLVKASLADDTLGYNWRDVKPCVPAHLPNLESLDLTGWPAYTFHPETLHSASRLTNLSITSNAYDSGDDRLTCYFFENKEDFTDYEYFIPPTKELYQSYGIQDASSTIPLSPLPAKIRPKWTWDWHLPRLVSIKLSSEFAFLFQFRMLQDCPAVQTLELEIRTTSSTHSRTITNSDTFTPSLDMIVAPVLTKLRMHGPWTFSDPSVAHNFLKGMFPNLESLSAIEWVGLSLSDLVHLIRTMPKPIKELFLDKSNACKREEMREMRFVVQPDGSKYDGENILSTVSIYDEKWSLLR